MKNIGFIDVVHSVLEEGLSSSGFNCIDLTSCSKQEIINLNKEFCGFIVRSRIPLDNQFLSNFIGLKFIARSGAGLENIDIDFCKKNNITLFNAPEGNRNAVAEHGLGMLLALFNNLFSGQKEVQSGIWNREKNRGVELDGKVVGIIGYGNNGSSFAKKLKGFDVDVLAYDKYKTGFSSEFVKEVNLNEIFESADIVSLHIPQTIETTFLVDSDFISLFKKPIYIVNMARGKIVKTSSLVKALESGKVLGACLDVLEYEKASFENMFADLKSLPDDFQYLINSNKVQLSPHVAGWSKESYYKLSAVLLSKIIKLYNL